MFYTFTLIVMLLGIHFVSSVQPRCRRHFCHRAFSTQVNYNSKYLDIFCLYVILLFLSLYSIHNMNDSIEQFLVACLIFSDFIYIAPI